MEPAKIFVAASGVSAVVPFKWQDIRTTKNDIPTNVFLPRAFQLTHPIFLPVPVEWNPKGEDEESQQVATPIYILLPSFVGSKVLK